MHPIDYSYTDCIRNCWLERGNRDSKIFLGSAQIILGLFLQVIGGLITVAVAATVPLMTIFFPIGGLLIGIALGLVQARIGVAVFEWGVEIEQRGEKLLHQHDQAVKRQQQEAIV